MFDKIIKINTFYKKIACFARIKWYYDSAITQNNIIINICINSIVNIIKNKIVSWQSLTN